MPRSHYLNPHHIRQLSSVLHVLEGAKVELTITVPVDELVKLSPAQLKAFFGGIAECVAADPKVQLTEK